MTFDKIEIRWAALIVLLAAFATLAGTSALDESDGVNPSQFEYGSGGLNVYFDANGGSGTYCQHVLPGNQVLMPTEGGDDIDGAYNAIHKDGFVLTGWERNGMTYSPGSKVAITSSCTFTAVWEDLRYDLFVKGNEVFLDADHRIVEVGNAVSLPWDNNVSMIYNSMLSDHDGFTLTTLTVYVDGTALPSDSSRSARGTLTSDVFTVRFGDHPAPDITGTPRTVGVYTIEVDFKFPVDGSNIEMRARWYVSAYDPADDASNVLSLVYKVNGIARYHEEGPWHTAVALPDSQVSYQRGWAIDVDGAVGEFRMASLFTLSRSVSITPVAYSADEVIASGVVGCLAYNANGGTYTPGGHIADLVGTSGYTGLPGSELMTKTGCTFIGWNASGSPSDPVYAAKFYYGMDPDDFTGHYQELKAVWVEGSADMANVKFMKSDGSDYEEYDMCKGKSYFLPAHGFDVPSMRFLGWSTTVPATVGTGEPNVSSPLRVTGNATYHPVYEPYGHVFTVHFDKGADAATGTMADQVIEFDSTQAPMSFDLSPCGFSLAGKEFAGWSDWAHGSILYADRGAVTVTGSGDLHLYAVWGDPAPAGTYSLIVYFAGNGADATNVPGAMLWESTSRDISVAIPSQSPTWTGHSFKGWTENQTPRTEEAVYNPGDIYGTTLGVSERTRTVTLFAQWDENAPQEQVMVTYSGYGVTSNRLIAKGEPAPNLSVAAQPGYSMTGWYLGDEPWDFTRPVNASMTLNARYAWIFDLDVDGNVVNVVMKYEDADRITVFFNGDGRDCFATSPISYTAQWDSDVTVSVSVPGVGTAYMTAHVGHEPAEVAEDGNEDGKKDYTLYYVAAVIVLILIALAWWYL